MCSNCLNYKPIEVVKETWQEKLDDAVYTKNTNVSQRLMSPYPDGARFIEWKFVDEVFIKYSLATSAMQDRIKELQEENDKLLFGDAGYETAYEMKDKEIQRLNEVIARVGRRLKDQKNAVILVCEIERIIKGE